MNQYTTTENGTYIVDRSGKKYRCNVAHPLPLPEGVEQENNCIFTGPNLDGEWDNGVTANGYKGPRTHWLARALPEVPRPKTPAQRDEEAYLEWFRGVGMISTHNAWNAALAYARQQQP